MSEAAVPSTRASVVVAVLTYRRPEDLQLLLPMLIAQGTALDVPTQILVVDNDPEGSAHDVVAALSGPATSVPGGAARYVHEVRPGIAAARNRALEECGEADVLVFIDDDEVPVENWLRLLVDVHRATGGCVVGPVESQFETALDPWVEAGDFFARRRLATGAPVTVAATNNLLLDLATIRRTGLRFDEKFGLSGGSDTLFTRTLVARGGSMTWCAEALVVDRVPASRLTRRWVLLRALRSGNSWARVDVELQADPAHRLVHRLALTGRGLPRVVGGAARALLGVLTRRPDHQAKGLRTLARGLGMVGGAWGYVYSEYSRTRARTAT